MVLCRTRGPRNAGSVVRAVANFGPAEVWFVRPDRPSLLIHPDFEQMAHGVEDVASKVRVVDALDEALADATFAVGFTARARGHRDVVDWRAARREIAARALDPAETTALVFGSEESGLSGAETDPLHLLVRLPTAPEHGSINLAMAVGIVLSSLFFERAPEAGRRGSTALRGEARAFLIARLRDVLGSCTTSAPARRDLEASIERVFGRAPLETRDARAWHLLANALGGERRPGDYGLAEDAATEGAQREGT